MESKISVSFQNNIARIELQGRVDATNAPVLAEELKKLVGQPINQIVFLAKELEYISSAGLRTIIFAKQKLGENAQVFLIAPQPTVSEVIKMSGLDSFLTMQDSFDN